MQILPVFIAGGVYIVTSAPFYGSIKMLMIVLNPFGTTSFALKPPINTRGHPKHFVVKGWRRQPLSLSAINDKCWWVNTAAFLRELPVVYIAM